MGYGTQMTLIKQIFADLFNCKSTKYNQWSSVASASSACNFIFDTPSRIPHDIEHTMSLFRTLQAVIQLGIVLLEVLVQQG